MVVWATDATEVSQGELRERMQQDLILHGMAPRTQEAYLTAVQGIAKYYHQRPDTLNETQLQTDMRFLLDARHLSARSVRVVSMGIRFFSTQTVRRPGPKVPLPKRTKTWPEVLRREEVAGKRKRGQPSKGSHSVRTSLGEAAWAATKAKGTFRRAKDQRVGKRLSTLKA